MADINFSARLEAISELAKIADADFTAENGEITRWTKGDKPTEEEVNAGLQGLLDEWNAHHQPYRDNRFLEYPKLWDQLEQIYDDIEDGKLDKTGKFYTAQKAVKDKYPKP